MSRSRHAPLRTPASMARPGVRLIRWVMLWFVLSLGAAIASPVVHPQAMELVCSASGSIKAVVHTEDGAQEVGVSHMDCPLCCMVGGPPSAPPTLALPVLQPLAHALRPLVSAHIASVTAAPLPARGPPLSLS